MKSPALSLIALLAVVPPAGAQALTMKPASEFTTPTLTFCDPPIDLGRAPARDHIDPSRLLANPETARGAMWGGLLGLAVGAAVAGPRLGDWMLMNPSASQGPQTLTTVLEWAVGGAIVGGLIGHGHGIDLSSEGP